MDSMAFFANVMACMPFSLDELNSTVFSFLLLFISNSKLNDHFITFGFVVTISPTSVHRYMQQEGSHHHYLL